MYQGGNPAYISRARRLMKSAKPMDWKTLVMPTKHATVRLNHTFSALEMKPIRRGYVPQQQEDKWFIYWKDDTLFLHRSWTGCCIYVIRFRAEEGSFRMIEADVNRDPEQYSETSDEKDVAMISYLVDLLLLQKEAVFPDDESSPEERALKNWSEVGRAMLDQHSDDDDADCPDTPTGDIGCEFVPSSWLLDPIDIDEIESDWLDKPGPYGVPSRDWMELKAQMTERDEIRAFQSPPDSWEHLAGRAGYALVREGIAIAGIITMMN